MLIPTGEDLGTFLVYDTLRLGAGSVGVSPVAGGTIAPGSVVSALTESILAALGEAAGEDTVPVDTLVRQRALQVGVTAGWTETRAESYRRPGKTGRAEVNNIV